jgi:hypothetical protein
VIDQRESWRTTIWMLWPPLLAPHWPTSKTIPVQSGALLRHPVFIGPQVKRSQYSPEPFYDTLFSLAHKWLFRFGIFHFWRRNHASHTPICHFPGVRFSVRCTESSGHVDTSLQNVPLPEPCTTPIQWKSVIARIFLSPVFLPFLRVVQSDFCLIRSIDFEPAVGCRRRYPDKEGLQTVQ